MEKILKYLQQNIDKETKFCKWNAKEVLSLQLAGSYEYFLVNMLEQEFLLLRPYEMSTIKKLKLQMEIIEEKTGYPIAVLLEEISAYCMKKMFEERVAFIAVNKQMYLPFMALHIRKQKKEELKQVHYDKFTPATQLIYLAILYWEREEFCIEELVEKLSLSAMTVVRGTEELKRIGVVDYKIGGQTGRKKIFTPIPTTEYYQIGRKYLQNPIKKEIYVREIPKHLKLYKSGLTALGEQTMLGEPRQKVFATGVAKEIDLREWEVTREQAMEEYLPQIQILKYDVGCLTSNEYVDPITLFYSLTEKDERIELAIDELMEDKKWFVE